MKRLIALAASACIFPASLADASIFNYTRIQRGSSADNLAYLHLPEQYPDQASAPYPGPFMHSAVATAWPELVTAGHASDLGFRHIQAVGHASCDLRSGGPAGGFASSLFLVSFTLDEPLPNSSIMASVRLLNEAQAPDSLGIRITTPDFTYDSGIDGPDFAWSGTLPAGSYEVHAFAEENTPYTGYRGGSYDILIIPAPGALLLAAGGLLMMGSGRERRRAR